MGTTAIVTLAAVLALIVLAGQVIRRLGLSPGLRHRMRSGRGRRLEILESLPLDARRRLLLVRCDGGDLLLLLGGPQDLVVSGAATGAAAKGAV
ncbi:flagellar biosynthetic protein FliO [Pararoseomonas baculiformis]